MSVCQQACLSVSSRVYVSAAVCLCVGSRVSVCQQPCVCVCLQLSPAALGDVYLDFIANYPVVSIEDAFDQDDWEAWSMLQGKIQIQLVG